MSRVIESILIPTDGSEGAISGAKRGIALASRFGADVHALSVVEGRDGPGDSDDVAFPPLLEEAEDAVEVVATMATDHDQDVDVTTAVERGTPFQAIREYAHRREIDVVVMGTKGRTGLDRVLLGSVTENVLRTARTPVLAVPPDPDEPAIEAVSFDRLLLPTDGSEGAAIATEWGIALARRLESMVHALHSVDTSRFPGAREPDELFDELESRGEDAIGSVRELARDVGVSVSGSLATGAPAKVILAYADDNEIDLIVMGTHGKTGIGQWFLGSVTENVVRQATVPVLCVPVTAESP